MFTRADGRPIFVDLADLIADDILAGAYPEDTQVPSTNELAAHYRINPATAGKALNRLVESQILYKKRGLGMFVAIGAPSALLAQRRDTFAQQHVKSLIEEGRRLGLTLEQIVDLVRRQEP